MRRALTLILLAAVPAALSVPASAVAAAACPAAPEGRCFNLTVPLDRSAAVTGTIRLRAMRIASKHPQRPPLIGLTGGPGQAGVSYAATYDFLLPMGNRDLVMLDQRGTGASGLLRCPSLEGEIRRAARAAAAEACARRLGPRRSFYTSADSAVDSVALRIRLGVPQVAFYATSYGTRVAVEYARRYPQRVEHMILDSPVPPDAPDSLARETLGAVGRVLLALCKDGCNGAEAHPVSDMRRLVARLRRKPIRHVLRGPHHATVVVRVEDVARLLRAGDLEPEFMRRIPGAVRAALAGYSRPLVRLKLQAARRERSPVTDLNPTLSAVTQCEETPLAWDPSASPAQRRIQAQAAIDATPAAAIDPFDRPTALSIGLLGLCGRWPPRERVVPPAPPLPTTVPTLILSGELDLRTPLEGARRLAGALHGRVVVEPFAGHFALLYGWDGCTRPAVKAFLAHRPLPTCRV
jgi:pimeloyl-ACP methyl ester carboxylesterase